MNRRPAVRGLSVFIVLAALVSFVAVLYGPASPTLQTTLAQALIFVVATVGFYVFVGNSGVFSFGQVAFMTVGAYVGGLLAITPASKASAQPDMPSFLISAHTSPFLACLIGGVAAALAALVLSVPLIRLSGIAASLTSFAVLQVVYVVTANWGAVTNGESGLVGIPLLSNVTGLWITAIAAIAIALLFQQSRWGRRLVAAREDDAAARALGIGVHRERRIAFVLSALIMGIAGAFEAELLGALVPETLYMIATTQILIMLVVGGTTSLSGAVSGSLFISALTEILRRVQAGTHFLGLSIKGPVGVQQVGLAVVMLLTLLLLPKGIAASREFTILAVPLDRLARIRRWSRQSADNADRKDTSEPPVARLNSQLRATASPQFHAGVHMPTALIIGDVQTGILDTFPWSRTVLPPLQQALTHARTSAVPVIFVRTALRSIDADIPKRNPIAAWLADSGDLFRESAPETQVHPAVAPDHDDPVVTKRRVSAFTGTDLDAVLRARNVTSLVLAGVATSGVVLATLLSAVDLDYAVTVLADCCADQDQAVHALLTTTVFPGRGARVTSAEGWMAGNPI
jgi:branched-chain amino acid transport system permease protein